MICTDCGRDLPADVRICPACGASLPAEGGSFLGDFPASFSLPEIPFVPDPVPPMDPYFPSLDAYPLPEAETDIPSPAAPEPSRALPRSDPKPAPKTPPQTKSAAPKASASPRPTAGAERGVYSSPGGDRTRPAPAADAPASAPGTSSRAARRTARPRLAPLLFVILFVLLANFSVLRDSVTHILPDTLLPPDIVPQTAEPEPTGTTGSSAGGIVDAFHALLPAATPTPFLDAKGTDGAFAYIDVNGISDWVCQEEGRRYYAAEDELSFYIVCVDEAQLAQMEAEQIYWERDRDTPEPPVFRLTGVTAPVSEDIRSAFKSVFGIDDADFDSYFGDWYLDAVPAP